MAVADPLHFIDLTLDSEDHLLDHNKSVETSDPYQDTVIVLDDDGDIPEILSRSPANVRKSTSTRKKPQEEVELSDDEVLILSSLPVASSSKITHGTGSRTDYLTEDEELARRLTQEYDEVVPKYRDTDSLAEDEELARRLAQEYNEDISRRTTTSSPEDERLALQLAQEEEENYKQLVESIENNRDGIVFSVVVDATNNTLEDGSPAHPDDLERFQPWKQLCEQLSGLKVKKFHWFVNYELEKRFELARDKLEDIMGERAPEIQLFHGTAAANVESILKGGFRIGGVDGHPVVNGTAMGHGIYLAAAATTSLGYAVGGNKIFACRVVPGRVTNKPIKKPPRSVHVGSESFECYSAGGVYVHRYASLVLPCYMIEFDMPVQPQYNWRAVALGGGLPGGMVGGMMAGMMGLVAPPAMLPPPLLAPFLPPPMVLKTRSQGIKPPTTPAASTARKRIRPTLAEGQGASVTPRKRQRKTQPAEGDDEDAAPPPAPASRKGKGKAKDLVQGR